MTKKQLKCLAMMNIMFNGKDLNIVQCPDWNGGHYFKIRPTDIKDGEFEYGAQASDRTFLYGTKTILKYLDEVLVEHSEPFHEKPRDTEVTVEEIIKRAFNAHNRWLERTTKEIFK